MRFIRKLLLFGWLEAISCIFPVIIFSTLGLTKFIEIPGIARYDLILIICLLAQIGMVLFKLETLDELKVICMFHVIGLGLEIFKVHMGSWAYPEEGWSKVFGVPLYSGFMYASVASYICQAWRRFDLHITGWPKTIFTVMLSTAIYLNFFTHHYIGDYRWILIGLLLIVFFRTWVNFTLSGTTLRMPMTLAFFLIGFFIWIAENISTFLGAWRYPNQEHIWRVVHLGKISSWFLLVVITMIIVAQLKHVKAGKSKEKEVEITINHIKH
ncbi:DUF817 domain-containing protein [Paenibacillus segetis]|uniref:DUF817 domain-containing protein n=1 Tax=Paenibacillus segetis TaxID=1325360 RepID=A0ABQ1YCC3_9BACL|nr:DUF817 domain-containing protein [Paenibacillus segetis]GGH19265.1 hypothetical protein GCM10008013_15820 [Paenibacillus segetis]